MASANNLRGILAAVLAIFATAVLLWFGNGLNPWWPLIWFAPLPVLLFAPRHAWWAAGATAFLASLAGSLGMWHYFHAALDPSGLVWTITYSIVALIFTAAVLLFRALLLRGAPWSALVAFPALWVSVEYLASFAPANGTAGSLAYTQLQFLPVLQFASITGPWGISFLLLLFPAAVAIALHLGHTAPRQALRILGAAVAVIALVLLFGSARLSKAAPSERLKVGLIASDAPGNERVADPGPPTQRLFRDYAAQAEMLAAAGAQVIVMPEKLGVLIDSATGPTDAIFQSLANRTGVTLIAGMVHAAPPFSYNQARIYTPRSPIQSYDKQHMLPPFESNLKPGDSLTLLPRSAATLGVAICKDMDFIQPARQYGHAGVGLLLDPGWDFNIDRSWHGHIAILRGVENGFSIAHAAKGGYLTVSDDRGRILDETRSDAAPFATLLAEVPTQHHPTLYLKLGDWFPRVAMLLLLLTLLDLYRIHRRQWNALRAAAPAGQATAHV